MRSTGRWRRRWACLASSPSLDLTLVLLLVGWCECPPRGRGWEEEEEGEGEGMRRCQQRPCISRGWFTGSPSREG